MAVRQMENHKSQVVCSRKSRSTPEGESLKELSTSNKLNRKTHIPVARLAETVALSPERVPRGAFFLKSSFGQRLNAQCGSALLHESSKYSRPIESSADIQSKAVGDKSVVVAADYQEVDNILPRSTLLRGGSLCASGLGSSGVSEVEGIDGTGICTRTGKLCPKEVTAQAASVSEGSANRGGQQVLKFWGLAHNGIPNHRSIGMLGVAVHSQQDLKEISTPGCEIATQFDNADVSPNDGSPMQEDNHVVAVKQDVEASASVSKLTTSDRGDGRDSVQEKSRDQSNGITHENSLNLENCQAVQQQQQVVPTLMTANPEVQMQMMVNTVVYETNSSKRTSLSDSFKNDCGLLKLLPSKRKFEQNNNSNSNPDRNSPVTKNFLHLTQLSSSRDSSNGKERMNTQGKPVVGSFMKWMIDVGKGLAKKRCFGSATGTATVAPPPAETSPMNSSSPTELRISDHQKMLGKCTTPGRGFSPARCQNMETEQQDRLTEVKKPEDGGMHNNPSKGLVVADSQGQHRTMSNSAEPDPSGDVIEGNNSHIATEGTATTDKQEEAAERHEEEEQEEIQHLSKSYGERGQVEQEDKTRGVQVTMVAGNEEVTGTATPAADGKKTGNAASIDAGGILFPVDASGDPNCPQGMAEFVASMASVKYWIFKCRSEGLFYNNNSKVGNTDSGRPCSFCGLHGHSVADCSETLDCELRELERRSLLFEEMRMEMVSMPCLRCLGMGHLGAQCRFTVTEAASRARENSQVRNWKFSINPASRRNSMSHINNSISPQVPITDAIVTSFSGDLGKRYGTIGKESVRNVSAAKTRNEESPNTINHINSNNSRKLGNYQTPSKNEKPVAADNSQSKRKSAESLPPVPKGLLEPVEALRLSRSDLWRWSDVPDFNKYVRGFFLRLRFGRWEKDLGGTGYRMARIRGVIQKHGAEEKSMSVSVDLGDIECTVDSQYVSNHPFSEAELSEWWRGRWIAGKRLINEKELRTKLLQRKYG